jgi:hypothetical protein
VRASGHRCGHSSVFDFAHHNRYREMARFGSNQALEVTATRFAHTFSMIKTFSPQLTLGSGSRTSACSR